jgi:CHAT domain-containing protein/Tfp pilus assembly protein PilF
MIVDFRGKSAFTGSMPIQKRRVKCLGWIAIMTFNWLAISCFAEITKLVDLLGEKFRLTLPDAQALHEKTETLYYQGDYVGALRALQEAQRLTEQKLGSGHRDIAVIKQTLAEGCLVRGDLPQALKLLEESLKICETALGRKHPVTARTFKDLASLELMKGNLASSETNLTRCLEIQLQSYPKNDRALSPTFQVWAMLRFMQGNYTDALADLKHSLTILDETLGRDNFIYGQNMTLLALIRWKQGDSATALTAAEEGLAVLEKFVGRDHLMLASALNALATVYQSQGKFKEAGEIGLRNLEVLERTLGTNSFQAASILLNLGSVYYNQGRYLEAFDFYSRTLGIFVDHLGYYAAQTATIDNNLGVCSLAEGDLAAAKWFLETSLEVAEKIGRSEHPETATTLNNLAILHNRQGDYKQAEQLYTRSLKLRVEFLGVDHPDVAKSLESIALFYAGQGMLEDGLGAFVLMFRGDRGYLLNQLFGSSDGDALLTIERSFYCTEIFQSLCAQVCLKKPKESLFAGIGAEQLALNKSLVEEVQTRRAALEVIPQTATRELRERYQILQNELLRLTETTIEPAQRKAKRQELNNKLAEIQNALSERVAAFPEMVRERNLSLIDVARSLEPQSVLVDFAQYQRYDFSAKKNQWKEQRYAAFLTFPLEGDSTNVILFRVDLGDAKQINEAVDSVCQPLSLGKGYANTNFHLAGKRLSALVYTPLANHLTNSSHLIICPDGQLGRLPFEMLPIGDKFLIEEKTLSYVTSGREVVRLARSKTKSVISRAGLQNSKSLVMGNPDFDLDLANSSSPPQTQSLFASMGTPSLGREYLGRKFYPLPGSEKEATTVANFLGSDAILRFGMGAREKELKAVVSPRVLHLATHGFVPPDQESDHKQSVPFDSTSLRVGVVGNRDSNDWKNPMVRCGIALAGANRANQITNATEEDGILTGLEASLLNLQGTKLVILSACDSGRGDVKIGEGVMSLRRAFRIAGAETVLASHWSVSDKATSLLMTEFIRRWSGGMPRGKAWREAQLALLHSKDFSNPYFWSAFTLTGQWR